MFLIRFAAQGALAAAAFVVFTSVATGGDATSIEARGRTVLHCYRPTARYERALAIDETLVLHRGRFGRAPTPHDRLALVARFGDADITWLRIYWRGAVAGGSYVSDVAVLTRTRGGRVEQRTELLADTGLVPVVPRVCKTAVDWAEVK